VWQALQEHRRSTGAVSIETLITDTSQSITTWNPWLHGHSRVGDTQEALVPGLATKLDLSTQEVSCAVSGIDSALWYARARHLGIGLEKVLESELLKSVGLDGDVAHSSNEKANVMAYCALEIPFYDQEVVLYFSSDMEYTKRGEKVLLTQAGPQGEWIMKHMREELQGLLEKNYRAIKLNMRLPFGNVYLDGSLNSQNWFNLGCELLRFARTVVGPDVHLAFDAMAFQEGWNSVKCGLPGTEQNSQNWAGALFDTLDEQNYLWLDEPFPPVDGPEVYTTLRKRLGGPRLSSGSESLLGLQSFEPWEDTRVVQILQPDRAVVGGVSVVLALQQRALRKLLSAPRVRSVGPVPAIIPHGFDDALGFATDVALVQAMCNAVRRVAGDGRTSGQPDVLHHMVKLPQHVLDELTSSENSRYRLDSNGYVVEH